VARKRQRTTTAAFRVRSSGDSAFLANDWRAIGADPTKLEANMARTHRGFAYRLGLAACLFGSCDASAAAPEACVPGMSFWSLLGIGIGYADGHLQMEKLYGVCLPQPKQASDSNYAYSPEQGGKLTTLIKSGDGATLGTYVWSAESIGGLWELGDYKVVGGYEALKPLVPGSYTLEFVADGTPFYRFPFAVATLPGDDPYEAPGTRWFIDGAWGEYGNVFYQRNDPQQTLRFSTWVRDKVGHAKPRSAPYVAQLVRVRDGKTLGEDKGSLRLDPHWAQLDVYFLAPGGDASTRLRAADVLAADGDYRVTLTVDTKPQGTYAFTVKGGQIQLQGLQQAAAPPLTRIVDYLSGGKYRSWWIRRGGEVQVAR
jgi:hypothetical protein